MKKSADLINIGTSGIVLPINKAHFPAQFQTSTRLGYYASLFNSLEINSTFYKTPMPKTFAKWGDEVPDEFTFTVKLSKAITHAKNLDFNEPDIEKFITSANQLGNKRGAILIQFPSSITNAYFNKVERIVEYVKMLNIENRWSIAIEIRHDSWYNSDTYAMLNQYEASLVFHDMPGSRTPLDHNATGIIYFRLHGPEGDYKGSYTNHQILSYSSWLKTWHNEGKRIFVYFNNTIGAAYNNAIFLQKALL